jgi:hypothetical protein
MRGKGQAHAAIICVAFISPKAVPAMSRKSHNQHTEQALDEALMATFPASDPVAVSAVAEPAALSARSVVRKPPRAKTKRNR